MYCALNQDPVCPSLSKISLVLVPYPRSLPAKSGRLVIPLENPACFPPLGNLMESHKMEPPLPSQLQGEVQHIKAPSARTVGAGPGEGSGEHKETGLVSPRGLATGFRGCKSVA